MSYFVDPPHRKQARNGQRPKSRFDIAYGLFRFAHEFWRATLRIIGPLSGYQLAAIMATGLGLAGFVLRRKRLQGQDFPD